jgi:hypothetical protein
MSREIFLDNLLASHFDSAYTGLSPFTQLLFQSKDFEQSAKPRPILTLTNKK